MIHHADFDAIEYETEREQIFQRSRFDYYPANLPTGYLEAREAEAAKNTDLSYAGEFDGVIGLDANPELWGKSDGCGSFEVMESNG